MYTLQEIQDRGMIIFSAIMGSQAYGTSLPTSDTDIRGVFIQPLEDVLKYGYVDQIADPTNDIIYYELKRFLDLVAGNNPNILELLNAPPSCILQKHPVYNKILKKSKEFLTKRCQFTFGGYAIQQIKKARGLNKKMNWEEAEMTRKTVLDFCYVLVEGGSQPFKTWISQQGMGNFIPNDYGLVAIDHARDLYAMYLNPNDEEEEWGIVSDEEKSNDVKLTSVPKGLDPIGYLTFNKDAYSTHCKRYGEYQEWLQNRNEDRFKMNKSHGKNYDSKNMMHTFRLLNMAIEIATKKEVIVRRPPEEIDMLMKIRRGEFEYDFILGKAEALQNQMDREFETTDLPKDIDQKMMRDLQYKVRLKFYKENFFIIKKG